ncbi:MAG: hypothetical protein IKT40_10775 [Bacilli bacterium]|nr:hypothetical protein [Bacilli bacterium]
MRKNLTKKLFLSVLTLAFAVVSLGASTYAWFTLSKDASVETFEGKVTAGTSGLEIQVTGFDASGNIVAASESAWSSTSITAEQINSVIGTQVKLNAVQYNSNYTFYNQEKAIDNTKGAEAKINQEFIAFNIHFRLSDSEASASAVKLYLEDLNFGYANAQGGWYASKTFDDAATEGQISQGAVTDPYVVTDCARVALKNNSNPSLNKIYEATAAEGGKHYTSNKYEEGAVDYYNKVHELTTPIKAPADYGTSVKQFTSLTEIGELSGTTPITVTVYVWVDGWDAECINNIFSQTLKVDLKFTIQGPTA